MIKVLHLIEGLGIGGAERRLVNDLRFIDKSRFASIVCSLSPRMQSWDKRLSDIPVYAVDIAGGKDFFKCAFYISRIIKKEKVDILHTQLFWADLVGRLCKVFNNKVRVLSTIQSTAHDANDRYLYSFKRKILDSLTGRLFNSGFIVVSDTVKQLCVDSLSFPSNKIRVIYNSVDLDYQVSQSAIDNLRKEFNLKEDDKVLISVGRLVPVKGHSYLIKSLSTIKIKIPGIKLLIVGDGPEKRSLNAECDRLGLNDNIIFTGNRLDVRDLLVLSDMFILPSLSGEGLSVALLEAQAAGIPCIATSLAANKEVIQDKVNGVLINSGDVQMLSDAVIGMFEDARAMRELSQNAKIAVHDRFSARGCAKLLEEYYQEVMQS